MQSVMTHSFSQVPRAEIPRSSFDRSHGVKTTFDADFLIPVLVDDIIPGDTFNVDMKFFARLTSPTVLPLMDNMYLESFFFFVPYRILWSNWEKFVPNEHGDLYTSDWLESVWKKGFCTVGELTFKSAAYVARYILKKRTGVLAEDHYLRVDPYGVACWLEPEYSSMSRRPGIGKKWFKKFKSDVFPSDDFPVPGVGVLPKPPRYYDKLLEAEDPEGLELVKQAREEFRKGNAEEYEPGRLMAKYKVKKRQLEFLRREL